MMHPRRLTLAHVDTGPGLRGGQVQLLMLARQLAARGHRQVIVCPDKSPLAMRAQGEGFQIFPLPAFDPGHLHGAVLLRAELVTLQPDIIHAHDGVAQTIAWLAGMRTRVKLVASRRVTFLPARPLDYRLKYTYTADAVIVVSEFVRQIVVRSGVPPAKVELIPDGVELPHVFADPEARRRMRAEWGFDEADFVIGHLGAFTSEKGQDIAVRAFVQVAAKLPQARLILAGEGYEDAPKRLGLKAPNTTLRFIHPLQNPSEFFSALDLYLMPSRSEGFGSSALLAMAHGLPVVAARAGGLPELIEEGSTGWLADPESPSSLAAAIIEASSDPSRLGILGQNARRRAEDFSADKMAARTEALYYLLIAQGAAPG
jgi:glycosyltransferase involved in cell wall biosynthesis